MYRLITSQNRTVINKILIIKVSLVVLLLMTIFSGDSRAQEVDLSPMQAGIKHIKTLADKMSDELDKDNVADSVIQNNLIHQPIESYFKSLLPTSYG